VLPLVPWIFGIIIAPFFLNRVEWQLLGISVYTICITLIAFNMGAVIGRITEIVPGELEGEDITGRSQLWYVGGAIYTLLFVVYDVLGIKNEVHHWFWGRAADLAVLLIGGVTLLRALLACKALKLDIRSS
jgi:hypothetical protein